MKNTAISNEELIAAIIESTTIKEAADKVGLSTRAVCERMTDRDFKSAYMMAKADIMRNAVMNINRKLSEAVNAIGDIMNDENVNAAVRLQAAQTILNNADKLTKAFEYIEYNAAEYTKSPIIGMMEF